MEINDQLEEWLVADVPPEMLGTPLSDSLADRVVELLKKEADRNWTINPRNSLEFAGRIVSIGKLRADPRQTALGLMAEGDALKLLGRMEEAWDKLEQAGEMFEDAGDEVGWARTRIGRLYLSPQLNCVSIALADAERAHAIFTRFGERDKLLRLNWQTALVHNYLGDQQRALELFRSAIKTAETLGEAGQAYIAPLYENLGLTYNALGDFHQALVYYEQAQELAAAQNETLIIARIEASVAEIAQAQGNYRRALALLNRALESIADESPFDVTMTKYHIVECYLSLNRYEEARELAHEVIRDCRTFNATYELARTLLFLATVEAALGNLAAADAALAEAEPIFASRGATSWIATIRLWHGQMKLKQGDPLAAYQEALVAADSFEADGQQVNDAAAALLQGQALFALGDLATAETSGNKALIIAKRYNAPSLRYAAYLLLGQISEARNGRSRAVRHYQAAAATIERVQRGLTITLRPGFLEDKGEALRRLIALELRARNSGKAFEALEHAKSQIWMSYLINREHLRWAQDDPSSQVLIRELDRLRAEHQWFYRLAHDPLRDVEHPRSIRPEQALAEVAVRERRMRVITEQLYLRPGDDLRTIQAPTASIRDVQQALDEHTMLIEYYSDGAQLWAFTLDRETVEVHQLPSTIGTLSQLIRQLQANFATALNLNLESPAGTHLTRLARRILQRLHAILVEPLALKQNHWRRLIIVPYGALHFLPFNLLFDGRSYLIESCEVVTLPAAGLVMRHGPKRTPGALILAHSWDGRLAHTRAEAQSVQRLVGGRIYEDSMARRSILQEKPTQVLHIVTHGEHRLDHPDLSYLQLADGQLYGDDVLQEDLSYELVTLSACETGRAIVAADEELIGIGRSFLYAGAGALILSLWSVADNSTAVLMERLYGALRIGASKAAALRSAQRSMLAGNPDLHPGLWGAFQLIGDASPLSGWAD